MKKPDNGIFFLDVNLLIFKMKTNLICVCDVKFSSIRAKHLFQEQRCEPGRLAGCVFVEE